MHKHASDIHAQFIELIVYWQGMVNSSHLIEQFKISRQQAHQYLKKYQQHCPQNLSYHPSSKGFLPGPAFTLSCISGDVAQYLDWLSHTALNSANSAQPTQHTLTYSGLTLPTRQVSPYVMRGLVTAIKQQRRIDVDYVSLTNPDGEGRIIQPHVFVKTGLRWHLRAFDEKHQEFRDFVLSRFAGEPDLLDKATHSAAQDKGWNTLINIVLAPDQRLSPSKQQVLMRDYQMHNGQLVIETRAALAQYLLQALQVNFKFHDKSPEAQQLVLVNEKDIAPWLFDA